jgi:catechol 2,3-dioxygenase-like lactoylglutathione lyase family enzyme
MATRAVPMIHVPDIRAAVDWYTSILGFTVVDQADDGVEKTWAMLKLGDSYLMFNVGGTSSSANRREVDFYVYVDNFDELYGRIKDRVEIVEEPHDTFYGMREFILRDLNRFWVTVGRRIDT